MSIKPIVSLSGPPEVHERALSFNERLGDLGSAREDLDRARDWNDHGRFGTGFFSSTKPPVPVGPLLERVRVLERGLAEERAAIVEASGGSVSP